MHGERRDGGFRRVLVDPGVLSLAAEAADTAGMDDSFSFRTTVPLRRQFDPLMVKAAILGTLVVLGIGLFSNWVIRSERESFSRADGRAVPSDVDAAQVDAPGMPAANDVEADAEAEEAAGVALDVATMVFNEHRSFLDAGPGRLSALQRGYTFVDGPSTAPTIVSVASTANTWAAAVQGSGGICHWVRTTGAGTVSSGTRLGCTGAAALDLSTPWPSTPRPSAPR
jgi:hypothetical protein